MMEQIVKKYLALTSDGQMNDMIRQGWKVHSMVACMLDHDYVLVVFERENRD